MSLSYIFCSVLFNVVFAKISRSCIFCIVLFIVVFAKISRSVLFIIVFGVISVLQGDITGVSQKVKGLFKKHIY
jgi:hypothetical protein